MGSLDCLEEFLFVVGVCVGDVGGGVGASFSEVAGVGGEVVFVDVEVVVGVGWVVDGDV